MTGVRKMIFFGFIWLVTAFLAFQHVVPGDGFIKVTMTVLASFGIANAAEHLGSLKK